MHKLLIAGTLAATALSSPLARADATTPDAYLSLSAGPSRAKVDCTGTSSCDRSSVAAKILFGYRIVPNFAIEASYARPSKVTATAILSGSAATASIKGQTPGIGVAGLLPFGAAKEWPGIARIGIASNRAQVTASLDGASASDSESHAEPCFGLGLDYAFTPNLVAGIAWDATKLKYAGTSARVNAFSVVGPYRF